MAQDRAAPEKVEIVTNVDQRWDEIAGGFADFTIEQCAAYLAPRFGASRLCGMLLRDESGRVASATLAVVAKVPVLPVGFAYVKFGPLWRPKDRPVRREALDEALAALSRQFAARRGLMIRLMPPADPDHGEIWRSSVEQAGFTMRGQPAHPARYFVDLTLSEAEQRASLEAKWRSNLQKALAVPLDIREVEPGEGLPLFLGLFQRMVSRKQFDDRHRIELLSRTMAAVPPALAFRIIVAFHEGTPVAGSILAGNGDRVFAWLSASDERGNALRAGYAVRWWIINFLRGRARWLDLGGTDGDPGLRHFKQGNVGKRGRILDIPGEYEGCRNPASRLLAAGIDRAMRAVGSDYTKLLRRDKAVAEP
jgi:hypothetical protein